MIEWEVKGLDELKRRLISLPGKIQKSILRDAIKEGAAILQKAASANAPQATKTIYRSVIFKKGKKAGKRGMQRLKPGTLKKSITVRQKRKGVPSGAIVYIVGPSKRAFYGQFVERGHIIRRKSKGPIYGHVRAYPFLRPALDQNAQRVVEMISSRISAGLDRITMEAR